MEIKLMTTNNKEIKPNLFAIPKIYSIFPSKHYTKTNMNDRNKAWA